METQPVPKTDETAQQKNHSYHDIQILTEKALNGWFEMDVPRIASHFQQLSRQQCESPAKNQLRVILLGELIKPEISETEIKYLYEHLVQQQDWMAASAAAGAGLTNVWDSGFDFRRLEPWLSRIDFLFKKDIPPLARASLAGITANALINGTGDINAAQKSCHTQIIEAEAAHSSSLRLFHAALKIYCDLWQGYLSRAAVLIEDTRFIAEDIRASIVSKVFFCSTQGLFHTLRNEPETGRDVLQKITQQDFFDQLPVSLWILVQSNLLFALAHCEDQALLDQVANQIRQRVIPQQNAFHHSYIHFSLGVASLGQGEAGLALTHAEQSIERGKLAYSAIPERMPILLKGQALADLGYYDEAIQLFEQWIPRWQSVQYISIAATATQELASICLQQGDKKRARLYLQKAQRIMPAGESMLWFHRSNAFVKHFHTALRETDSPTVPIQIQCLGEFSIKVADKLIYDRKWRAGRTRVLLKALITFGGKNISIQQLADLIWPDAEGDRAYKSLKVLLWRLRRIGLEKDEDPVPWLQLQHGQVSISEKHCQVDVFLFESALKRALSQHPVDVQQLKQALDLYAGDFLKNDESESWIIEHRERLKRRYLDAVLRLVTDKNSCQQQDCLQYLYRALDIDPLDERIYANLMRISIQTGYPARALEIYHSAQDILNRELNINPGAVLASLAEQASNHSH